MITETARVVAIEADCIWVETRQKSVCGSCVAEKGCGQKLLSAIGSNSGYLRIWLDQPDPGYVIGQEVTIGVAEGAVVQGSLLAYLLPLGLMVLFVIIVATFGVSEVIQIFAAVLGLAIGGAVTAIFGYRHRRNRLFQPELIDSNPLTSRRLKIIDSTPVL